MDQQRATVERMTGQSGNGLDINKVIARAKGMLLNPAQTWPQIKQESMTVKDVYMDYLIVVSALPAVAAFLGSWLFGRSFMGIEVKISMMQALSTSLFSYILHLILVGVVGFIISQLAPKFGGAASFVDGVKLVAFAATGSYVAGIFALIPALWIVPLIGGLYSIYLFWTGIAPITAVPAERKGVFCLVTVVVAIVTSIIIGAVSALFMPRPAPEAININVNGEQVDFNEQLKAIGNMLPKQ